MLADDGQHEIGRPDLELIDANVADAVLDGQLAATCECHRRSRNVASVEQQEGLRRMVAGPVLCCLAQPRDDDAAIVRVDMRVEVPGQPDAGCDLDPLGRGAHCCELARHRGAASCSEQRCGCA